MRKPLAILVVLVVGVVLGRLSVQDPVSAEGAGGGEPPPPPCQDTNGDGRADIADAIFIINWLFYAEPGPECADSTLLEAQIAELEGQLASAKAQMTACIRSFEATEADLGACQSTLAAAEADLELCRSRIGLPDTGQTTCYNQAGAEILCDSAAFPGQDGFYQTGCQPQGRFIDNGDGTVTDNCTGLMWQQATAPGEYTWQRALQYCEDLDFAGHNDWRLPNVTELQSILDYGRSNPAIDPVFNVVSWWYWSSTSGAEGPSHAWAVGFHDADIDDDAGKNISGRVLAVRTAP